MKVALAFLALLLRRDADSAGLTAAVRRRRLLTMPVFGFSQIEFEFVVRIRTRASPASLLGRSATAAQHFRPPERLRRGRMNVKLTVVPLPG